MQISMNIIILGPQGSGKGTQAELLAQKFNLEHIDMGGTLRELAKMDTPLGKEIHKTINVNKGLIPDGLLKEMLRLKFGSLPREEGIVLDGAPRTLEQAKFLESLLQEYGKKIDKVFFVNISEKESINRISKRWNCDKCKAILIMGKDIKRDKEKCPKCQGDIFQREDDTEKGVKKRLEVFRRETMPVVEYYREKGILAEINGEQEVEKVFEEINKYLSGIA